MASPEYFEFWAAVDRVAKEVASWPEWKQKGLAVAGDMGTDLLEDENQERYDAVDELTHAEWKAAEMFINQLIAARRR